MDVGASSIRMTRGASLLDAEILTGRTVVRSHMSTMDLRKELGGAGVEIMTNGRVGDVSAWTTKRIGLDTGHVGDTGLVAGIDLKISCTKGHDLRAGGGDRDLSDGEFYEASHKRILTGVVEPDLGRARLEPRHLMIDESVESGSSRKVVECVVGDLLVLDGVLVDPSLRSHQPLAHQLKVVLIGRQDGVLLTFLLSLEMSETIDGELVDPRTRRSVWKGILGCVEIVDLMKMLLSEISTFYPYVEYGDPL